MRDTRNACNILVGKPLGKHPLGRYDENDGKITLRWNLGR
jgi:hypothetical protein